MSSSDGRRPTIGVDIGGTKVLAGVVDADGTMVEVVRRDTPADDTVLITDVIVDVVGELAGRHPVRAVGIGAAGFVDAARSTVLFAPNLAWRSSPLRQTLQQRIGLPVVIENDANAAGWAEARFGAGRGEEHVVTVTVGTGIGGGIVVHGQLLRGRFGIAAEIGHHTVVPGGRRCGCGQQGCWEQYASGRALVTHARQQARDCRAEAAALLRLAEGCPDRITGEMVTRAAQAGDPAALRSFDEIGLWLGRGLANLVAVLDPGVFVLGGGVSAAGELLRSRVAATLCGSVTGAPHRPVAEVRIATLGPHAGLVGAADLARHH